MHAGGFNPGLAPSGLPWGYPHHNHHRPHRHLRNDESALQQTLLQTAIQQAAQNAAQTQPPSRYYEATHKLFPDQPSAQPEVDTFRVEAPEELVDGVDDDDLRKDVKRYVKKEGRRLKSWAKAVFEVRRHTKDA